MRSMIVLRNRSKLVLLGAVLAALPAAASRAAVLANYNFEVASEGVDSTPTSPALSVSSTDADANSTATALGLGSGVAGTGGNGFGPNGTEASPFTSRRTGVHDYAAGSYGGFFYTGSSGAAAGTQGNAPGSLYVSYAGTPATIAEARTGNDYVGFSLAGDGGATLNLSSFSVDYTRFNNDAPLAQLYASTDGFATPAIDVGAISTTADSVYTNNVLDLSTISALQNVAGVEFRIYFADSSGSAGRAHSIDNVTVNGTAVVPEPAALGLIGVGAMGALRRRARGA
ncbi:MAG TPA: PEP-CTERM sorting domain-containing protein [Tepidisphaeraceae bacterium]|nr:PEP-CTERM sorting domain-containing protein [Tepidisphaeraceae bacterium]